MLVLTAEAQLEEETAFVVEVHQAGIFTVKEFSETDLEQVLATVCPSILFPYSRESLDALVVRAVSSADDCLDQLRSALRAEAGGRAAGGTGERAVSSDSGSEVQLPPGLIPRIAAALERFRLRLSGNMGTRNTPSCPISARIDSGRPRVSGPKTRSPHPRTSLPCKTGCLWCSDRTGARRAASRGIPASFINREAGIFMVIQSCLTHLLVFQSESEGLDQMKL